MATTTGSIPFGPYKTWYTVFGEPKAPKARPLIVLHGGPGIGHDYLLRLKELAARSPSIPVVFYDQVGCGRSSHITGKDNSFFTIDFFLAELDNLLEFLDIKGDYDLFGHSWGGVLASEHALRKPAGLKHLILASSPTSFALLMEEKVNLIQALSKELRDAMFKEEEDGKSTAASKKGWETYNSLHVCRVSPLPAELAASLKIGGEDRTVFKAMAGSKSFKVKGTLEHWSIAGRASEIDVPTLVTRGWHDFITYPVVKPWLDEIKHSRLIEFSGSSHVPHLEEKRDYLSCLYDYLQE